MKKLVQRHLAVIFSGCDEKILKSRRRLKNILCKASLTANSTVVETKTYIHAKGVGCFAVISESHIAITTFPKYRKAVLDIHTCGSKMKPQEVVKDITSALKAKTSKIMTFKKLVL